MKKILVMVSIVWIFLLLLAMVPNSTPVLDDNESNARIIPNDDNLAGPPSVGDWIISNETTLSGQTFNVKGRVYVTAGGHLTLVSCDVTMHSQTDWWTDPEVCCIIVAEGGYLTLTNTHIHSGTQYRWYISADGGSGVNIQGCTFEGNYPIPDENYGTNALLSLGGWPTYLPLEYAIIKNNVLNGIEGAGIYVSSDNAEVTGNSITNVYSYGIEVVSCPYANITYNTITNVGTDLSLNTGAIWGGTGMVLGNCDNVMVSNNTIINPATRGFAWTMGTFSYVPFCSGLREFEGNTVNGEEIAFFQDSSDIVVGSGINEAIVHNCENVTFDGFSGTSIAVTYSVGITIKNSEFTICPLDVSYSGNVLIENNLIQNVRFGDSVSVQRCSNVHIRDNLLNQSPSRVGGIYSRWSSHTVVENNSVWNSIRWGITVMDDEDVLVTGNKVYESGIAGIVSWRSSSADISNNEVYDSRATSYSYALNLYTGYCGIDVQGCDGISINDNLVSNSFCDAIWLDSSNDATVSGNYVEDANGRGICVVDSLRPVIEDNYITNITWIGLEVFSCSEASISNIVLMDIRGVSVLWHNKFVNQRINSFDNVTLDGKQIVVYQDHESLKVDQENISGAILINCSHSRIEGLEGNFVSVLHSDDVIVRSCDFSGAGPGFSYCSNVTVASCTVEDTPFRNMTVYRGYLFFGIIGITMYSCENALVVNNQLNNTGRGGIDVFHSIPARIIGNEITNSGMDGISLWQTREATVVGNYVNDTWGHSITLDSASKSKVYLNYFGYSGNTSIGIQGSSSQLTWDNGTHGNSYFDYEGIDQDNDGIGDTPYLIDEGNTDYYPLVDSTSIDLHVNSLLSNGPLIGNVTVGPSSIVASGNATFNATVVAEYSVASVLLSYSYDGGITWTNVTMTYLDGIWTVTLTEIPGGNLLYRVYAMDSLGNWAVGDQEEISIPIMDILTIGLVTGIGVILVVVLVILLKKRRT